MEEAQGNEKGTVIAVGLIKTGVRSRNKRLKSLIICTLIL